MSERDNGGTHGRRAGVGAGSTPRPATRDGWANQPNDQLGHARELCLQLLTARPRTCAELRQALLKRGVDADTAEQVLDRLDEVGLIDDAAFAEMWVRSRHTYQGMGRQALVAELRRKGVADSVAASAADAIDADAEETRARQLVRKRLRTIGGVDEATKVRRLVSMLARKGYSAGVSYRVVREELRDAGEETDLLDGPIPD